MPSIQIKNVPADVHRVLRRRAADEGMSLQEYLLAKLTEERGSGPPGSSGSASASERAGGT